MASSADLESWKALGGTIKEDKKRKRFIAPSGEEYTSWADAHAYLQTSGKDQSDVQSGKENAQGSGDQKLGTAPLGTKKANGEKQRGKRARQTKEPAQGQQLKEEDESAPRQSIGSGRQVAQGAKVYRESGRLQEQNDDKIVMKEDVVAANEADALERLKAADASGPYRLVDFVVVDNKDEQQPLELHGISNESLLLSGTLLPKTGKQAGQQGVKLSKFGPIQSWSVKQTGDSYQICVKTNLAEYVAAKPAASFKKMFGHLMEQTDISFEVQRALVPSLGGDPATTLDEVVARLARAKVGKAYAGPREALRLTGKFVLNQLLCGADSATQLATSPFVTALRQEMADVSSRAERGNGITIREAGDEAMPDAADAEVDAKLAADIDYARQLQAKLDAEEARGGNRRQAGKGGVYIKINESEIADDYPEPAQYEKEEEETDELLLLDEEMLDADPEDLPRRLLTNFAVYNAEGLYASLELLPMWSGLEPDVQLFASGRVLDDDGEWAGGQTLGEGSGSAEGTGSGEESKEGMWLALSQIQEWVVEFSCDMLLISIRTDIAWYRLSSPTTAYAPWFNVVLKCARLAVGLLKTLSEEARASRLSFTDIVKRLAATDEASPTFISKKADAVERFVVVHGQIILNQFKNFPKKSVANSAFATGLKARMELRRHCKLYLAARPKARVRGLRANPMRDRAHVRMKPMTATATTMVKAIWRSYFNRTGQVLAGDQKEAAGAEAAAEGTVVEDDINAEDDEAPEEDALAAPAAAAQPPPALVSPRKPVPASAVAWAGAVIETSGGCAFYRGVKLGGLQVAVGDIVALASDDEDDSDLQLALLQALWQTASKAKMMQVRLLVRGADTVLGDAASDEELFATETLQTRKVTGICDKVPGSRLVRDFHSFGRGPQYKKVGEADAAKSAEQEDAIKPVEYFYRSLYLPHQGMFCQLPKDLQLGQRLEEPDVDEDSAVATVTDDGKVAVGGTTYGPGDCIFVHPHTFNALEDESEDTPEVPAYAAKGRFHKGGANAGLRAFGIACIVGLARPAGKKAKNAEAKALKVQRFWRPEDISRDAGYRAGFWDVYAGSETEEVDFDDIIGPCSVLRAGSTGGSNAFVCVGTFNRADKKISDPPAEYAAADAQAEPGGKNKGKAAAHDSGKGKIGGVAAAAPASDAPAAADDGLALATMDIFAGCGGLSEGLHRAGAARTKWAIEYEAPAAEAFKINNPDAVTWCCNCNVLLAAAMTKAGAADFCDASDEAKEQAGNLDAETLASLPAPGEVDFLCGGPPCQGYSGMNRFNKGTWSLVQNSMVMAYLSYADFYRPRYFLLENVRNFVSHNKSHAFRLTLRSLLDMGYQVRFGVLNAGNFGVSQSRKRTFIWGVAPDNELPQWPAPLHVFHSPQLTIKLPGGVEYTAVPKQSGAPLRTVTVKDAIGDLPPLTNGADVEDMDYTGPPVSAFQKAIRGDCTVLHDHICKEMNELNLERCRCIPKNTPGADWRVLQEIVAANPDRATFKGQPLVPWCLPNTADRHNGWRGLFGRLDYNGHFPTSVTDPQPMGKVGQVFHPDQDRIVSVRECARAQGFPDSFRFYGNVHNKHRQIGNAVPVPLAFALGRQLRSALEESARKQAQALLAAQLG
ncbi:DNA (cytosine-5)-methyltransferase 1B [Coccomyxa sp. Obi]|nr:DNA (cytosine-5)-methyltransferase 1B [Coccomyxa sp. Obi]